MVITPYYGLWVSCFGASYWRPWRIIQLITILFLEAFTSPLGFDSLIPARLFISLASPRLYGELLRNMEQLIYIVCNIIRELELYSSHLPSPPLSSVGYDAVSETQTMRAAF